MVDLRIRYGLTAAGAAASLAAVIGASGSSRRRPRCPTCGMVVWPARLDRTPQVEVLVQTATGGGRAGKGHGFAWSAARPTQEELDRLARAIYRAALAVAEAGGRA